MEIRKTNLGVEYELELSELGSTSVKVIATFPNVKSEWKEFEIKITNPHKLGNLHDEEDVSLITNDELNEAQQYINEQAIMYVSMELAKLMGDGKCIEFKVLKLVQFGEIRVSVTTTHSSGYVRSGLQQIEELIKQIRYGS